MAGRKIEYDKRTGLYSDTQSLGVSANFQTRIPVGQSVPFSSIVNSLALDSVRSGRQAGRSIASASVMTYAPAMYASDSYAPFTYGKGGYIPAQSKIAQFGVKRKQE